MTLKGLFTELTFRYASFPSTNLTGEQLVPIFLQALLRIETCGFHVTSIKLDGCSVNKKFYKIIADNTRNIKHKFQNPLSSEKRDVFLFSDPPHLIKTVRNGLANPKRNMHFKGRSTSWDFVKQLYEMTITNTGLTTLPKIRHEHIFLTNFSKMRVDLAAHTVSTTVAKAMRHFLTEEAEETANFIEKFDWLNVTNYQECY
uniref:Transposable element P transposase-like GTP-binding insertion domain-containing protein n=2 Tax=Amphimedon queenslandica TaxID=400682 RepID=A0A1X7TPA2_AMPQE